MSLAITALVLACTLSYPFNNDNALYAYMAALLLEGVLPYVGSWDQNFPGILLVHAPQILLLGRSQLAFHLWDIALQLVGAYFLFRLAGRWGGSKSAFIAPVILAFYYVQQGLWMAGERDTYFSILLLASVYFVTDPSLARRRMLLGGVLFGLALLFRPTYGLLLAAFGLYFVADRQSFREHFRFGSGAALPWILILLVYLIAGGTDDFYQATISFNTEIYIGEGSAFSLWEPVRFYWPMIPFSLVGIWSIAKKNRPAAILLTGGFIACVVSIIVLYRHSVYHYHPAMTLFLLMSAVGLGASIDYAQSRIPNRSAKLAASIGAISMIFLFFATQTLRGNTIKTVLTDLVSGKIGSLEDSYRYYEGSNEFGTHVQQDVGEYLSKRTSEGEKVQMFGPYSYPQYYSHTSTTSRFQTLHALTMRKGNGPVTPVQMKWRAEYLADLVQRQPKYFIVCDAPDAFRQFYGGRLGHEILREDMTDVGHWLEENYAPDTTIGAFTIYSKNVSR